ncbi:MAG: hypothetical protein AAGF12_16815 [Myxococcota bacterium]
MRTFILGVAVAVWGAGPVAAQEQHEPAPLILQGLFTDDAQWESLTRLGDELPAQDQPEDEQGPEGEVAQTGEGGGGPAFRGSLDVDVVSSLVADRARQVGMRAIADAVTAAAGPGADRQYVQDLLGAAQGLLLDGGRLQRTHVEKLVKVLVRMIFAEVVVRTRFPEPHRLDRGSYWTRRLCSPGRGHRRPTAESLDHCRRLRMGLPNREMPATLVHLYLLDLAYWRFGQTGFFAEYNPEPPSCPFRFGEPGNELCQILASGVSDRDREARIDWVLNLDVVLDGLQMARSLQPLWRGEGTGIRGFLRVLLDSSDLGAFGGTPGLKPSDWANAVAMLQYLEELERLAAAWTKTLEVKAAIEAGTDSAQMLISLRGDLEAVQQGMFGGEGVCAAAGDGVLQVCRASFRRWLERAIQNLGPRGAAGEADVARDKLPPIDDELVGWLDGVVASMADLGRALGDEAGSALRDVIRVPDGEVLTLATLRGALGESTADLTERLFGTAGYQGVPLRIDALSFEDLGRIVVSLNKTSVLLKATFRLLRVLPPGVMSWREWNVGASVVFASNAVLGADRLLRLLRSVNLHSARESGLTSIGNALRGLEALGIKVGDDQVRSRVLEIVSPVLGRITSGQGATIGIMFELAAQIREEDVLAALGFNRRVLNACGEQPDSLGCWTVRIVQSLREAMRISNGSISIDGSVFRSTLAGLGDDFRAKHQWRVYFHLTVGLGEMMTFTEAPGEAPGTVDGFRLQPIINEQIGIGVASPSFWGDNFNFRVGAFASGILYRAVLDSAESEAVIFGGFAALDLYQLLEIYIAPSALFFPEVDEGSPVRFGLAIGAQVPLGDYLSRL